MNKPPAAIRPPRDRRTLAIGILSGFGFVAALVWIFVLPDTSGNVAETEAQPLLRDMEAIGAKKLCTNSGSRPGNTDNWHEAYYSMANSPTVTDQVTAVAAENGYTLAPDTAENEYNNPNSNYLYGKNSTSTVRVWIHRMEDVSLDCPGNSVSPGKYGRMQATGSDTVIVQVATYAGP